jgi:hypothetical protein
MDLKRRSRERAIASEIAHKIYRALGPAMPEALVGGNRDVVCGIFADVFDSHGVVSEASGGRILEFVPKVLASLNLKYAELHRQIDAAIRHRQPAGVTCWTQIGNSKRG